MEALPPTSKQRGGIALRIRALLIGLLGGCLGSVGLLCLMMLSPVYAERPPIPLNPFPSWLSEDLDSTTSVAWGDVDGDGDLDLAVGNLPRWERDGDDWVLVGGKKVYLNQGPDAAGGLSMTVGWTSDDRDYTTSVAWGDVDGDGDLDLAAGNYGEPLKVYLNENGTLLTTAFWTSTVAEQACSIAWGDVDGDGDLDLAVGNNGWNKIYRNGGLDITGNLSMTVGWTSNDENSTYNVAWGDVDGDGDLDLAVGNDGNNKVYLNEGGVLQTAADDPWTSDDTDSTTSVAWGDVDGDGDLDLAAGNRYGPNKVYLNEGLDAAGVLSMTVYWTSNDTDYTTSVAWGDVDGDGDLELVAGNDGATNKVYVNSGGRLDPVAAWASDDIEYTRAVAWGDADGDGDLDLAVVNDTQSNVVYQNIEGMLPAVASWASTDYSVTRSVAWGDVDGDGDLDLAVGNNYGPNKVYRNGGLDIIGNLSMTVGWTSDDPDYTYSVAWGDVDGDGDLDLAVGNDGNNKVYRNGGLDIIGNLSMTVGWTSDDTDYTYSVAWGDVDGDGDLDLAVGNDRNNKVYLNEGGVLQTAADDPWTSNDEDSTYSVAWGDVDNDGDLDLAAGNLSGSNKVYLNEGGTLQTTAAWLDEDSNSTRSVAWGDVDGDGDLDLAVGNWAQPNKVYLNEGGTLLTTAAWVSSDSDDTFSIAWADVNGDGALDLAAGNDRQTNKVYLNGGVMLHSVAAWVSDDQNHTYSVAWGDVDGDGDLDLAAGNASGINKVYRNHRDTQTSVSPIPVIAISQPGTTAQANFYATAEILHAPTLPITYTLTPPYGQSVAQVKAFYSLNGGGGWLPAKATGDTRITHLGSTRNYTTFVAMPIGQSFGVFTDIDIDIADEGETTATLALTPTSSIMDLDVWVTLTHTQDGDLVIDLESPVNEKVRLVSHRGSWGRNFTGTVFDDEATTSISEGEPPFSGPYRPEKPLANFDGSALAGTWALIIEDTNAAYTGMLLSWGITATIDTGEVYTRTVYRADPVTYTYTWDVLGSGFMGQSDNVVFRIEAVPATYPITNHVSGPYLYGSYASNTSPFRVQGTQVRVYSGTVAEDNTVSGATVYRLPKNWPTGGFLLADDAGRPFRTDQNGYLQGRGKIHAGDRLVALLPITYTDSFTLYYTNASPTPSGLNAYTVTTATVVQPLTVKSTNPLLLLNMDVSLEWDARNDTVFLEQLKFDLRRASEILFDATNGQAALGDLAIYHDKENWDAADIQIYASNALIPNADVGGIVRVDTSEVINSNPYVSTTVPYTLTYRPGAARMSSFWNRYGAASGTLGEDWPRTLAHELGHYLFYLYDTYIGLDERGVLVPVRACTDTLMTSPFAYTEFHPDDGWATSACATTLSAQLSGRSGWGTIATFYPITFTSVNTGPAVLPLAVTQITEISPTQALTLPLDAPVFSLTDEHGAALQPGRHAQALLYQGDRLIDLGRPSLDQVHARGARPGDTLCVYELSAAPPRLGCETIEPDDYSLAVVETPDWWPEIVVTPISSTIIGITVTHAPPGETLKGRLYASKDALVGTRNLTETEKSGVYTTTFALDNPATEGHIRVWVEEEYSEADPRREAITSYALSDASMTGGCQCVHCAAGSCAPSVSTDGQVLLYGDADLDLDEDEFYALQRATRLPDPPSWATAVGDGYYVLASPGVPPLTSTTSILFRYREQDVPPGEEAFLNLYYLDSQYYLEDDVADKWLRLPTVRIPEYNEVSAAMEGPGLYALMSSLEIPLYRAGWNLVSYPVQATRAVSQALQSIDDYYSIVYGYVVTDTSDPWKVYGKVDGKPDGKPAPDWVNDLKVLHFGRGYWIHVSDAITLYLKGGSAPDVALASGFPSPPATYYGAVLAGSGFTPTAGMPVTASVGSHLCGQGVVTDVPGYGLAYVVDVPAEDWGDDAGCGAPGRRVSFQVGPCTMFTTAEWDNNRLHELSLSPGPQQHIYLPLVMRKYVHAPDLVTRITPTGDNVQVVIKNQGNAPVTDDFWVDLYVNPNPVPTAVNQIWNDLADEGVVWDIKVDLLPGGTITLTIGDTDTSWEHTGFSGSLAAGTWIYVQVDSANTLTDYGGVLEDHEIMGGTYNNITGRKLSAPVDVGTLASDRPPPPPGHLPPRP